MAGGTVDLAAAPTLASLTVSHDTTAVITGAGGTLNLGASALSIQGVNQVLNMVDLDTFNFSGPTQNFSVGGNVNGSTSTVSLAKTSTLTTAMLKVSDRFAGNNTTVKGYLNLGMLQTTINSDDIYIGYTSNSAGGYDTGFIQGGGGTLKLRNTAGSGRINEIKVGRMDSASYTTNARGTLDLSAVTTDALVNVMSVGQTTGNNGGNVGNGTVMLGAGTLMSARFTSPPITPPTAPMEIPWEPSPLATAGSSKSTASASEQIYPHRR